MPFDSFPHPNSPPVRPNEYLYGKVSRSVSQSVTLFWSEFSLQSEPWEQQFLK